MNETGHFVGSVFSACFLLFIGLFNCFFLYSILKDIKKLKGTTTGPEVSENQDQKGGLLTWIFGKKIFKLINKPYKLYFIGVNSVTVILTN